MFIKQRQAEEVKFQFQKSARILAFSFVLGDDFNFFVATNNLISLYEVKLNKQKAKMVKHIQIVGLTEPCEVYVEQMASTVVYIDSKGQCQTYFLNQHKHKNHKGKLFNLDLSYQSALSLATNPNESMTGQEVPPSKQTFTMRAVQYFKGQSVRISLAKAVSNNNITRIAAQRLKEASSDREDG